MAKHITTLTSREFSQDSRRAMQADRKGPVFITDRGRPAHVLLTVQDYRKLARGADRGPTLADLGLPGAEGIEFDPRRLGALSKRRC